MTLKLNANDKYKRYIIYSELTRRSVQRQPTD